MNKNIFLTAFLSIFFTVILSAFALYVLKREGVIEYEWINQDSDENNEQDLDNEDEIENEEEKQDNNLRSEKGVELELLEPDFNQTVSCPINFTGRIPGNWFFEASAVAQLIDQDGNELSTTIVTTTGEWMTTEPLLFSTQIECPEDCPSTGSILFIKENPSGQPENNDSIEIPIKFGEGC